MIARCEQREVNDDQLHLFDQPTCHFAREQLRTDVELSTVLWGGVNNLAARQTTTRIAAVDRMHCR